MENIENIENYNAFAHPVRTLHDLIWKFQDLEAQSNDDTVIELNKLKVLDNAKIQIPNLGDYQLTDWSRKQMSLLVGIKYDRWFNNASPADQSAELTRRFARSNELVRLRTRKNDHLSTDGILRGFVSPKYTPVKDSQIARLMLMALRNVDPDMRLIRANITDRTVSYVIGVGQPYLIGGLGDVGDVWGGILVRNSDVGYASLKISLHLTRLVCRNGMTAPLKNAELLRRKHTKGILDDNLLQLLGERLIEVPGQLRQSGQVMLNASSVQIANPEEEIERILDSSNLPKRLLNPVMAAYAIEPRNTAFGVISAFTRAAQQGFSPEERLEIENAASAYLQTH
ncbi:MAG: DUF932 domain-containing protein [Candidatus Riflebacteria bacterium]|nr:DUF932 domain-containing protein [Candidatus Riflebacteria bacterium]